MSGWVSPERCCETLPALLGQAGVVGVSRFHSYPALAIGPTVCTLVYSSDTVRIDVIDARELGHPPFRSAASRSLDSLGQFGALASWSRLRAAAFAAPSCTTPRVRDGIAYHHAALDWQGGIEATWDNPGLCPAHRHQCELVDAYDSLIESSALLLAPGAHVRVRTGPLAGLVGKVDWLENFKGRVRVVARLGGTSVTVNLPLCDIESSDAAD